MLTHVGYQDGTEGKADVGKPSKTIKPSHQRSDGYSAVTLGWCREDLLAHRYLEVCINSNSMQRASGAGSAEVIISSVPSSSSTLTNYLEIILTDAEANAGDLLAFQVRQLLIIEVKL